MKLITTGELIVDSIEDGGQAIICDRLSFNTEHSDDDNGMFVIIQSWDEEELHSDINLFKNKKVKITIETID